MSEWLDNSNNANCFKSMYVNGFVDVSGIIISREPTLGLVLSGDASFNAGLSVSGDTSFNNLQVATASRVGGIKIGSNLAITADGTLSISDDLSLNGRLSISDDLSLNGRLDAVGTISGANFLDIATSPYDFDHVAGVMYGKQHISTTDNDGLQLGQIGSAYGRIGMSILNTSGVNFNGFTHSNHGNIQFHTHESGYRFRTPMTIKYNGNVGIGTNDPQYTLDVSGNANLGDFLHIAANSTEWATPGKGLFMRYSLTGTQDGGYIQSIDRTSNLFYPLSFDASKYAFNRGNVGIGVSAPDAKLHIHGGTLGRTAGDELVIANFYNINPHENKLKII